MRTRSLCLALALAAWLPSAARAGEWDYHVGPTGLRRALTSSVAELPDGSSAAVLRIQCHPDADGALCVSLKVEDAERSRTFDFAAFEGPDAPARGQRLLSARWTAGAEPASLEAAVTGSFVPEPKGAFRFELCGPNRGPSDAATLAGAIAGGGGEIEITVHDPAAADRAIRVRFRADAADGAAARAVRGCWKPASHPR